MTGCSLKHTHDSGFKLHKNVEMCLLSIAGGDELSSLVLLFAMLTVVNFLLFLLDEFLAIVILIYLCFFLLVYIALGFKYDLGVCI
jgi:divalent metal cation (Fe/Co/Zn/Cd) transporter